MVFGKGRKNHDPLININIQGTKLDIVTQTKFLGIILEHTLSWKSHIIYLSKKIAKSIGILSRARKFLNSDSLRQLYYSFLFPYLSYANIIWGNAAEAHLWPIFKLQKRAIRTILSIRRRDSTKLGFQTLKILRLPDIYTFSVLLFIYKFRNKLLPPTFDHFYYENRDFHAYRTRSANVLRPPLTRTNVAATFVKKTGVAIWTNFSDNITTDTKIGLFKKNVRTLLLSEYSTV
jgi:hypothetical protein